MIRNNNGAKRLNLRMIWNKNVCKL